jgi:hypothetical protein
MIVRRIGEVYRARRLAAVSATRAPFPPGPTFRAATFVAFRGSGIIRRVLSSHGLTTIVIPAFDVHPGAAAGAATLVGQQLVQRVRQMDPASAGPAGQRWHVRTVSPVRLARPVHRRNQPPA